MASQMLDGGVPLPVVSQRLGHSSVRVTADIYSHAIHGQDDGAVLLWAEYQKSAGQAGKLELEGRRAEFLAQATGSPAGYHAASPLRPPAARPSRPRRS